MPALEFTFGAFVLAIPFGIRAVSAVVEARRILKLKQELLDCLQTKVDKLLLIAALMDVDGLQKHQELCGLLGRAAHHIGTSEAGRLYCEQNGASCYQTLVHNAEVYFSTSSESLQILINEANSYTNENRDLLKLAHTQSAEGELRSMLEQEQSVFAGQVSVHHREQFGKLEAHFDNFRSGCLLQLDPFCSGSPFQNEIESI